MKKKLFLLVLAAALLLSACGAPTKTEAAENAGTAARQEAVTLQDLEPHLKLIASAVSDFYGLDPDPDYVCYPVYESKEAWANREAPTGLTLLPNSNDYSVEKSLTGFSDKPCSLPRA